MKENNLKIVKGLIWINLGFCVYLEIYIQKTGFNFEHGLTWGKLTPIDFILGWTAYQLALIWKSESGNESDVSKVKKIASVLFVIIFLILPFFIK